MEVVFQEQLTAAHPVDDAQHKDIISNGFFSKFTKSASANIKKLNGRTDALEAVCAACALVAGADGNVDDSEVKTTISVIKNNAILSAAFTSTQIEGTADAMFARASGGRSGRFGLYKEINDVAADAEIAEVVFLAALDVADQGGIDDKEKAVLTEVASKLGLDARKYELV